MGEIAKRSPRSSYSDQEIETGLTALALVNGNSRRAAAALKQQGLSIPRSTLQKWMSDSYRSRYLAIAEQEIPHTYARIAQHGEAIAERLMRVQDQAVTKLEEALKADGLSANEISTALRNAAVSAGIAIDKASVIRGRPTEIREERTFTQLARSIHERFGHVVKIDPRYLVESTAEEVKDEEDNNARDQRGPHLHGDDVDPG